MRHIDYEDGLFGLLFEDFYLKQDLFDELAIENTAYTWDDIIQAILKDKDAELLESLNFDSESSMFVVRSLSQEALNKVEKIILNLFNNEDYLKQLLADL